MKNHIVLRLAVALACVSALLLACQTGMPSGMGKLRIRCVLPDEFTTSQAKGLTPRVIGPVSGWKISAYRMTFTAQNGEVITKTLGRGSLEVALKVGEWICRVEGLSSEGASILEQEMAVVAEAGKTNNLSIPLHLAKGKGTLQLAFVPTQTPGNGWTYAMSLAYKGLPGDSSFQGPEDFSSEIAATETAFNLSELESGYYSLTAQLKDASATTIAGAAMTVLILPNQTSSGECHISLSEPSMNISIVSPDLELSKDAAVAVDRYLSREQSMFVPLALRQNGNGLSVEWYANGNKIESPRCATFQSLGDFSMFLGKNEATDTQTIIKMDALISENASGLSEVVTHTESLSSDLATTSADWIQSIDYRAAMGESVFKSLDPVNAGTGVQADVKWVATNPSGLIAVAGLDKSSGLHLFYSPCGLEAEYGDGSRSTIPSSAGWLRLWRDKVVVDKSERNVDRLSVSPDGSFIAAGASTSAWLRIYSLDAAGSILSKKDIVSTKDGAPEFGNIKAMRFSSDSKRLFVLANSPGKIFVLNMDDLSPGGISCESEISLDACFETPPTTSLGMEDMMILSNGWIAACSSNVARIYFIRYSETAHQFSPSALFSNGAGGESLGDPKAIAYNSANGLCYVLGCSQKLHVFACQDTESGYTPLATLSLSGEFDKDRSLVYLKKDNGIASLVAAGGLSLGIIGLDANGQPAVFSSLASLEDPAATNSVANVTSRGDSILAAGGSSGYVAMYSVH